VLSKAEILRPSFKVPNFLPIDTVELEDLLMPVFLMVILWLFCIDPVFANDIPLPHWEEYCPAQYLTAETGKVRNVYGLTAKGHLEDTERNYWASRRQIFNTKVQTCSHYPDSLQACYDAIRLDEVKGNADWNQWIANYRQQVSDRR
jgi:hypothetical protein